MTKTVKVKRMENTDLQINDWVYLSEKGRYPMRVKGISESGCLLDFDGNEGDPFDGIYGEGGIAPIPMTKEILLLNGWKYEDSCCFWTHPDTSKVVSEISLEDDRIVFFCYVSLTYIHEFQHVLRLAKLGKMADNLKIK